MIIWLDAHLPPKLAEWMRLTFHLDVFALRDLGLRHAKDLEIFKAAKEHGAVVMTKDKDFVALNRRLGPPPQIIWITIGNTTNEKLIEILGVHFLKVKELLNKGESLIEIRDK